jgi:hypothetical protein
MKRRLAWTGLALAVLASVPTWCLAADPGAAAGKGAIGGQLGVSSILGQEDYSAGAGMRFSFAGHWRYHWTKGLRWQVSPGFLWAGYEDSERAPFVDRNFPEDTTKADYLTLLAPVSAQIQFATQRGSWLYYAGAGPGLYRVWVQNNRKVLADPVTFRLHRGVYPGATAQVGIERFLKSLPNTSVEVTADWHWVFAERNDQFPSGFNSSLLGMGIRVGGNYYFDPYGEKKKDASPPLPGSTP